MISIITPWLNHSELIPMYECGKGGAQVIIVDNGSEPKHAALIEQMCRKLCGEYIRNDINRGFSTANNQGLAAAAGDIIVFLNNDVETRDGWLNQVARDVQPGALYGPSLMSKHGLAYIEGWCIAGCRDVWTRLGGWDDQYYQGLYWEDNDLCYRAMFYGIKLLRRTWPVWHRGNYTTEGMFVEATAHSAENERKFLERVRSWQG
jgi:GT2 family glycosyltransferase